jgi:2-hydroxychromene-2-carboxylate isomerase
MKTITLYIDFKSAASYLAMDSTLKLINAHDIEVIWKPYQIRVQTIADEKDNETTTESHLRVRETQRQQTHLKYAGLQGKPMVFRQEPKESIAALMALAQFDTNPVDYIQAAFLAYWKDGLDLNDAEVVKSILNTCDINANNFHFDDDSKQALTEQQTQAEDFGVFDTPMYILGEARFLGREQLPWIQALLKGDL